MLDNKYIKIFNHTWKGKEPTMPTEKFKANSIRLNWKLGNDLIFLLSRNKYPLPKLIKVHN